VNAEIITPAESVRLCELERIIQKGKDTFVEVGTALSEIRDSRIYRATFATFEDYCETRWGFSKRHCDRLISAAETVNELGPVGPKPTSERQARELAKAPKEHRAEAMEKAREIAAEEGKPVAARHVEAAVAEVMPKTEEPEAVVVDGIEESAKRRSPIKVIEDEGMNIWLLAKSHLDRINKNDTEREQALKACAAYCQFRLESKK